MSSLARRLLALPDHQLEEALFRLRGEDILAMADDFQRELTLKAYSVWRSRGFPFPQFEADKLSQTWKCLEKIQERDLNRVLSKPSTVGLSLANSFQPGIWHAKIRGKSPIECFYDNPTLLSALSRAPQMRPNRLCWNANAIRQVLGLWNRGRVSNFRPTVARAIYCRYSNPNDKILDFSAGYGGRLLGAMSANRHYLGIDPGTKQASGLQEMYKFCKHLTASTVNIINGCAEDVMEGLPSSEFNLVFSSPPYFSKEKYSSEPTQSYIRYPEYDMWLESFLKRVIRESHRVLTAGGFLIINVANTPPYPLAQDCVKIAKAAFGQLIKTHRLTLSSNPAAKARDGSRNRQEPIFVFRKTT